MEKDKRGYLKEQHRIFHLVDKREMKIEAHYHDFHKILVHLEGEVTYFVNDKAYSMKPGDIIFIPRYQMHYCNVESKKYERFILWVSDEYLREYENTENLLRCFEVSAEEQSYVYHPEPDLLQQYLKLIRRIEETKATVEYGKSLYAETFLIQFLIEMNRLTLNEAAAVHAQKMEDNPHVHAAMQYIQQHLTEDLKVKKIAEELYISPSYLMHRFRRDTGFTIHQYILQRRIFVGTQLLQKGENIGDVAKKCGFQDYSTFFRAFKKTFGKTPGQFLKRKELSLEETWIRE